MLVRWMNTNICHQSPVHRGSGGRLGGLVGYHDTQHEDPVDNSLDPKEGEPGLIQRGRIRVYCISVCQCQCQCTLPHLGIQLSPVYWGGFMVFFSIVFAGLSKTA